MFPSSVKLIFFISVLKTICNVAHFLVWLLWTSYSYTTVLKQLLKGPYHWEFSSLISKILASWPLLRRSKIIFCIPSPKIKLKSWYPRNSRHPIGVSGSTSCHPIGVSGSTSRLPIGVSGSRSCLPIGVSGSRLCLPIGVRGSRSCHPIGVRGSSRLPQIDFVPARKRTEMAFF